MFNYMHWNIVIAILGSSSRNEAQFVFETFLLTLRKFLSVILRMNTLFSPSRVRVLPEK